MGALLLAVPAWAADKCAVVESRAALASLSGAHISALDVVNETPDVPLGLNFLSIFHPSSRQDVIRRQLLFTAGDSIDTLRIGETMRRLRSQRLFSDVVLFGTRCDPTGDVAVQLRTRDTWTLRPTARLRAGNQLSIGVEERNFLGSGRSVSLTREVTVRGVGAAGSLTDPFLFGSNVAGTFRLANLAGGHTLKLGLRQHEFSVFDKWRSEANLSRLSYGDTLVGERALHTIAAMASLSRRIARTQTTVLSISVGAIFDSAASISPSIRRDFVAGTEHVRSFRGISGGVQRRTAQFDSASWIVPGKGFLDVPLGWEGDAIVAGGYEHDARTGALLYDAWTGRVFLPNRGQILMVDGWMSGYLGHDVDKNAILRGSMSWYSSARRGMWGVRLTGEQLVELDPDRRALSLMPLADYTAPLLRLWAARGGRSVAGSIDRDVRLFSAGASSVVNAGAFLAGSYRWRVDDVPDNKLSAAVIGGRFRILSANGAISSIRMDIGYPLATSQSIERKPFVVLSYGALFDVSRQRDGRRLF